MAAKHGGREIRGEHFGSEGRHRAPDAPGDTTTKSGEARRPGTRRKPSYRRTPVEILMPAHPARERTRELPAVRPSAPARRRPSGAGSTYTGRRARRDQRAGVISDQGIEYARRAAIRQSSGGKPSTVGRATGGAAAGAATGAAIGSVVPGIGTAVGAGAGAVVGGTGGAVSGHKAKKAYKAALRAESAGPRKLLLAEFAVCATITALAPITDAKRSDAPGAWMKRMTAVLGLFFVLGLLSAGGRSLAKVAAGVGGLVTVVLLVSERNLFVQLAKIFNSPSPDAETSSGKILKKAGGGED